MFKNLKHKISWKLSSFFKTNLVSTIRFHWHTTEWTGYLLILLASTFFIAVAYMISQMITIKNDTHEIQCLATNIYHEARGEPRPGKYAVSVVTLNRVKSKNHPDNVCQVVYHQVWSKKRKRYIAAFSWTAQSPNPKIEPKAWQEALRIAKETYYDNDIKSKVKDALFYHADYVKPRWAKNKVRITKIGRHIFYE